MKFSDLKTYYGDSYINIELSVDTVDGLFVGDYVDINVNDNVLLIKKEIGKENSFYNAKFLNNKYRQSFVEKSHRKYICQIEDIYENVVYILMIYDIRQRSESEINPEGITIAVTDDAIKNTSIEEINSNFLVNYRFSIQGKNFFLLGKHLDSHDNSFVIVDAKNGRYYSVVEKRFSEIGLHDYDVDERTYVIESSEKPLVRSNDYKFILYDAVIKFEDKTNAKRLSEITKALVLSQGDKYVRLWKNYTERQMSVEEARKKRAGWIGFSHCNRVEGTTKVRFYITNENHVENFYNNAVRKDDKIQVFVVQGERQLRGRLKDNYISGKSFVECEVDEYAIDNLIYKNNGFIELDISGSYAVYNRRKDAITRIQNSKSANPTLACLLEGRLVENIQGSNEDEIELNEDIIKSVYKNGSYPNPSQLNAIKSALSSRDFVIIQGPPGTGKTKVIKAIRAHLQANGKNIEFENDRYLLTAYQKDATQNMAAGEEDEFGFPIIARTSGNSTVQDYSVSIWRDKRIDEIEKENPDINMFSEQKRIILFLRTIKERFEKKCHLDEAVKILQQICDKTNLYIQNKESQNIEEALKALQKQLDKLSRRNNVEKEPRQRYYVKIMPTSPVAMSDNGMGVFEEIINFFEGKFSHVQEVAQLISELKTVVNTEPIDFKHIRNIRTTLAITLENILYVTAREKENIILAITQLSDALKHERMQNRTEVISEYLSGLYSEQEVQNIIRKYQQVVAATHQLSAETLSDFNDVIVDEAARSCPADLLIPLSMAKKRVILVGDHKQLPQFVEDEVLKDIVATASANEMFEGETEEAIKEKYKVSTFEYMLSKVEELKKVDPLHERVVSLNVQYRMPPVLGSLVARNFYKDEKTNELTLNNPNPPLDPKIYEQNYSGIAGLNMLWVDVSKVGHAERQAFGSWYRPCEAKAIVNFIRGIVNDPSWLEKEKSKRDRIGVITFYSQQRDLIRDLIDNDDAIDSEIAKNIEVGTVDSFQGKEFPIVFLSMVRSNSENKFGFLTSKNRMCVALSRAQKCLVVVGNSDILKSKQANKEIPALVDFYNTCVSKEGGVCGVYTGYSDN